MSKATAYILDHPEINKDGYRETERLCEKILGKADIDYKFESLPEDVHRDLTQRCYCDALIVLRYDNCVLYIFVEFKSRLKSPQQLNQFDPTINFFKSLCSGMNKDNIVKVIHYYKADSGTSRMIRELARKSALVPMTCQDNLTDKLRSYNYPL